MSLEKKLAILGEIRQAIETSKCKIAGLAAADKLETAMRSDELFYGCIMRDLKQQSGTVAPLNEEFWVGDGHIDTDKFLPQLRDGMKVYWRRGRSAGEGQVGWSPWAEGILDMRLRATDLPKAYRKQTPYWRKGDPCSISIRGMLDWAEYDASQLEGDTLVAEDYFLQLRLDKPKQG